ALTALSADTPQLDASLPIAMFDSGVGGLTVLHECLVSLPEEDFVYLGDTAMFPYGTRDPDRLRERIGRIAELLLDGGAKLLVIACNTATSIGEGVAREVAAERAVEVVPVVEPQAEIAAAITDSGRVGVLATPNTVESGAYRRSLEAQGRALEVTEVEAPDLAPFIQDGSPFDEDTMAMARAYCEPLKRAEVDTLILGCTHYPLVAPMLQRILGRDVRLVSGGHAVAAAVQRSLERRGLAREPDGEGEYRFLCTGDADSFRKLGTRFLQMPLGKVEAVSLPDGDASTLSR
ncbi:MAG TPA: glutamate racemase, partial [Solirubrobacterales bacterium]|nr:glutamate racemase [Solirubrobacterales bacterium]